MLHSIPSLFLALLLLIIAPPPPAAAAQHNVGDKAGWRLPSAAKLNYTQWASRYTFHVEDTLHFRYDRNSDNVLQVKLADYISCSNSTPIHAYSDGDTIIYLLRNGDYWFISGAPQHCSTGQKFFIRVLPHEAPPGHASSEEAPAPQQLLSVRGGGSATKLPVPALPSSSSSPARLITRVIHQLVAQLLLIIGLFVWWV